jgi:hypothetical protein
MRVVWVLAIACLVAAGAVRPLQVDRRDSQAARIEGAPPTLALVARREAPQLPDVRLAPVVIARIAVAEAPVMVALVTGWAIATPHTACALDTPCARGPPTA